LQQPESVSILDEGNCNPSTSSVVEPSAKSPQDDLYQHFKFPIPPELIITKTRPPEKAINKFIRDCLACLQAYTGTDKISPETLTTASKKICDMVPVINDAVPPTFYKDKNFPYWVNCHFKLCIMSEHVHVS